MRDEVRLDGQSNIIKTKSRLLLLILARKWFINWIMNNRKVYLFQTKPFGMVWYGFP